MASQLIYSRLTEDPDYLELVVEFVSNVPSRVQSIKQSMEQGDAQQLSRLIHQLRGACGSYGFHEVTAMAASLEGQIYSGVELASLVDSVDLFVETCLRMTADPVLNT